ncbi:undecaprenyldiphospho-muramoylpentapeptide beta-N-acetylglucosaminyltransferase [Dasania sp. GY-MA-18]|uniref:UDP-N-acetylglucosamine--N-acetylmuramyl-(pentapeptide) pyrophosphoryl-undecaprenol N-acetylglucosamine transferase n=1 Tax=Dasania phycosphaerae TaxID=2950436 RepID=A0A9J6RP65_9GAMM|nr:MULTISPECIES: undecaprenyldiphospho-muramoylpentapeptide beta-N-acetylglucosaminyltransferase [Dasania]MCR8923688.1 undecaprenyldiphospho-muramoylpentapeptide beta-N-acetylglucosaminyltransferase [Dasania sp. GY-MA-18]MCZ0866122.1 undecaprenyldiphospho-muramoylpentapeptide beta-N-acetylglucosaminyltransferase [Dasania phycosphaerae]MCZ0869846.1 undecaprenyldiphospho-muramoylpentapeptide beta-N-acetylglucosaminyltransferase [Dasania phycosphaerae]
MTAPAVLIMAGGTGGHVFPALAAVECLRAQGVHVEWLGTAKGIESRLVPEADIKLNLLTVSGLRGKGLVSLLKAPWQLLQALIQALKVLRRLDPVCVLGMGGFVAGPGGLAAWLTGRPLVIHEQNAVAGTTNRLLARFAKVVLTAYPINLGGSKNRCIGNPVREDIAQIVAPELRWQARKNQPLHVLVLGGSLGAKALNDALPQALLQLDDKSGVELWHQTGSAHIESVKQAYNQAKLSVKAEPFIEDMAAAYSWADVVICRAGALTVAELTAAGVGSLLIPLPHAIDDHQTENARWLANNGAGLLLPQSELNAELLSEKINHWMLNKEQLLNMAKAARALAKNNAAADVAATCMEFADAG